MITLGVVRFRFPRGIRQIAELKPGTAGEQVFGLSEDLVARIPWENALEVEVAQESWLILKDSLLQAQELSGELRQSSSAESKYMVGEGRDELPRRKTCRSVKGHN